MNQQHTTLDLLFKKYDEAQQRYQQNVEEKRRKAKLDLDKVQEVHFIQMMESQSKKQDLDEKLLESQERKRDMEKQAVEKRERRKQKEWEVRRKKKEYEDERVQKIKLSQQKREEYKKKDCKKLKTKRTDEFKILLDQSYIEEDGDIDRRLFKSLSPSLRPLESDQIVYFKLTKQKDVNSVEKKKKLKKLHAHKGQPQKAYRDASVPTRHVQCWLPILVRNAEEYNNIVSPMLKAEEDPNSNQATPKKEEEGQSQYYRICQICNVIINEDESDNVHQMSKMHKQTKQYYGLTTTQGDILTIKGLKDEIASNRFSAVRKRCQKIKQKIASRSLQLEHFNIYSYKEPPPNGLNRQRIQKISNELDKLMNNQIKDLYLIENLMRDLLKLINQEIDLINLRQMKFIQIMIEAYKKVSACRKNEYQQFLKIIGIATEIVYQFCSASNNRTYMLVGNKVLPIIDFMYSFLATKPTKFIYGFPFVAQCFQIFSLLIKHRLPVDPLQDMNISEIQVDTIEYFFCCGIFHKMKQRFLSFEKEYINSEGKIPVALVKSVAFIEAATNYHGFDTTNNSLFEESHKIPKTLQNHINFVVEETDVFGLINLISQMLVGEGVCLKNNKLLPQTIISFLMVGIKTLNNIARLNLQLFQKIMNSPQNRQETHMIMQSLVMYCKQNMDQCQDLKDLLNEVILMIGYYCVLNQNNQNSLVGPMQSISLLHNLTIMPPQFYVDKTLKQVLLPTIICCIYQNPQNMQIVLNEMDKSYFLDMLQHENTHDFQEYSGTLLQRSPSMSSTNSQNSVFPYSSTNYFKLAQRFPVSLFQKIVEELLMYD